MEASSSSESAVSIGEQLVYIKHKSTSLELDSVDQDLTSLRDERIRRLKNRAQVKELVLSDEKHRVCSKLFPLTTAWFFGGKSGITGKLFEEELEQLSEKHKICLVGSSYRSTKTHLRNALLLLSTFKYIDWPQDMVDFSFDEIRVPVMRGSTKEKVSLWWVIQEDRKRRDEHWSELDHDGFPLYWSIDSGRTTWQRNASTYALALASKLDRPAVMNLTYNEGGNTLLGTTKGGEPCAIIGLDSVAATRAILERNLDHQVGDETLRTAFSIDYGVKHIWFVEQPGDFHLDMSMAFVAPGVVVLNDSLVAHEMFANDFIQLSKSESLEKDEILKKLDEVNILAQQRHSFEEIAAKQLSEFGFEVHRYPGRYFHKNAVGRVVEVMNMFNFVTATTPSNERLVVALNMIEGSDVPYKEAFCRMLEFGGEKPDHIEFLSLAASQMLLRLHGGLSCCIKTIE